MAVRCVCDSARNARASRPATGAPLTAGVALLEENLIVEEGQLDAAPPGGRHSQGPEGRLLVIFTESEELRYSPSSVPQDIEPRRPGQGYKLPPRTSTDRNPISYLEVGVLRRRRQSTLGASSPSRRGHDVADHFHSRSYTVLLLPQALTEAGTPREYPPGLSSSFLR
jgi:hypothetical protein